MRRLTPAVILLLTSFARPEAGAAPADDLLAGDPAGRLSSALYRLARAEARGVPPDRRDAVLVHRGRRTVTVVAELRDETATEDVGRLARELGGRDVAGAGRLLRADLPLRALRPLSLHPDVERLRRPRRLQAAEVVSEGVGLLHADVFVARTGADGHGARVGVLDSDFQGLDQALGGELPADTILTESVTTVPDEEDDHGHGTACAEIVHDMAPGATLVLAKASDEVRFVQAIEQLRVQGVHVVSSSIGYPNLEDPDGRGYYTRQTDSLAAQTVWVNAAGNYGDAHHEGTATDLDADGILEFRGVEMVPVELWQGSSWVSLRWDEARGRAYENYDLLVVTEAFASSPDLSATNPAVVGVGSDVQDGDDWAFEEVELGPEAPRRLYVVVVRRGSLPLPPARRFSIMLRGAMDPAFSCPQGTITQPADGRNVVAAAALDAASLVLRGYSSRGPTTDGRIKPDLAGVDGVSSPFYVSFTGTSAAAPHVAGAAALILSREPGLTSAELREKLMRSTTYPAGPANNDVGWGLVDLDRLP